MQDMDRQATYSAIRKSILTLMKRDRWLYIMALPGILYFIVFKYFPMWGITIAFQDYMPFLGISGSKWVGIKHFVRFFQEPMFFRLLRNTVILSLYNLVFYFPLPIILALLLNEVSSRFFKRLVQTVTYLPHFISWVVIAAMTYTFLNTEQGIVNQAISAVGGEKINFLMNTSLFRPIIVGQVIFKETGWGTILFLAAITAVDPQLYESAVIDGAGRWKQTLHITLPALKSTIVVLLILRMSSFMNTGFDQIYNIINAMTREVGEVFDTYVYEVGISAGQYSYTAAVGLFNSLISLLLVLSANFLSRKLGEEGII